MTKRIDFMARLGGADESILASVPAERPRFIGIATSLLATASIASVSMIFALSNALKVSWAVSIPIGLLWGFIILNTDRWLVLSLVPVRSPRRILLIALPRVALSLLISVVISTPLVLTIFSSEISAELRTMNSGTGILAQLQALSNVSSQNSTIAIARWLIYALFFLFNLLPLIVKFILSFGPVSQYEIAVRSNGEQAGLPDSSRLLDVLHLESVGSDAIVHFWEADGESAQVVIGESRKGPFGVDLRQDGAHVLIGGTVGSGKSELLQTIVASLAISNRPDSITFMLVDYKGGATFKDCALLPHTVGMITDLDEHLMGRVLLSLSAEVTRRDYMLRSADEPLPRLLVLVDEFTTLTHEFPEFAKSLVDIARRGRALGIHLILAAQRPPTAIPAEIRANTSIQIAFRMPSIGDSIDVIDADNSAYISAGIPGRAYVRIGGRQPVPIQVSWIGGPRPRAGSSGAVDLSLASVELNELSQPMRVFPRKAGFDEENTDLRVLVEAIRQANRQAGIPPQRSAWLPPLPETLLLSDLTAPDEPSREALMPGGLTPVIYGLSDFPAEQAQRVAAIDFPSFGHMLAIGASGSGKSQLLRTIAGSIAVTHSCADVHIYVIDEGNSVLLPIAELPHCGAVVTPAQSARITRLIARLSQEIGLRRELLARGRFKSIGEQRASVSADQRLSHIFLFVDCREVWTSSLSELDADALANVITEILAEGSNVGMHLVMTGSQALTAERIAATAEDKLVFRMERRTDYSLIGLQPRTMPTNVTAGRAFHAGSGVETQVALLDGEPSEGGQAAALQALANMVRRRDASVELSRRPFQVDVLALVGDRFHVGDAQGRPVGREDILAWLRDRHASGACVALLGPRRAGKTWVLTELKRRLVQDGSTHVHHIVVPQPSSSVDTPDALACLIDRRLRAHASPAERLLDEARLHSGISSDRLVYLLDEVGRLVDYDPAAVSWLRDLGQAGAWLVYTGTEKDWHKVVRWALTAPGSSFGNDVNARPVGPIDNRSALVFLTGTAANLRVNLAESTAVAIIESTGSWPFYLQVVGDAVVRQVQAQDSRPLTDRQALQRLIQQQLLDEWTHHFQARWAEIGIPGRAALLTQPGTPPEDLAPAQRDDLRDVGLLRPGDVWLDDRPFFAWIARNAASLHDGERQR